MYIGSIIKQEDAFTIIKEYNKGFSLVKLNKKYNYNIGTLRYFLLKNNIKIRSVKESVIPFHKRKELILILFYMKI